MSHCIVAMIFFYLGAKFMTDVLPIEKYLEPLIK